MKKEIIEKELMGKKDKCASECVYQDIIFQDNGEVSILCKKIKEPKKCPYYIFK